MQHRADTAAAVDQLCPGGGDNHSTFFPHIQLRFQLTHPGINPRRRENQFDTLAAQCIRRLQIHLRNRVGLMRK